MFGGGGGKGDVTFRIVFYRVLQVLYHALLTNDLLNPGLGIHVKRIRIHSLDRPLPLCPLAAIPVRGVPVGGGKACRVVQGFRDMGLVSLDLRTGGRVTYYS